MTHALSLTPLYGAHCDGPLAALLRLGDLSVLLDCGWDDAFSEALLQPLLRVLPQVDLVLLSQPDVRHTGALPYLAARAGLAAPVYATAPVARLAPLFLYDAHTSLHAESEVTSFGPEHIDAAFDDVTTVKHHQRVTLKLKGQALRLLAFPAGHMVGGTVWVVEAGGEVVVYGPDTNHVKERHLNAGQLPAVPVRPALLVAGAGRGDARPVPRAAREKALEEAVLSVLRDEGSVLLPVDCAGRCLEVLLVLDRLWTTWARNKERKPYSLVLLSCVASSTLHAARGLLEWMSDELQREFNFSCANPLACKLVAVCHSVHDVLRLPAGPKVVLATGQHCDYGMARQLLLQWGGNPRNAVVFTQPPRAGTLAATLLAPRPPGPLRLALTVGRRVPLQGAELEAFEAARAAAEAAAAAAEEAGPLPSVGPGGAAALLPMRESSGSISQIKRSSKGGVEQVLVGGDAFADMFGATPMADEGVLMDGFAPPASAMYPMFPDEQELLLPDWDAYGAVVDTSGLRQADESLDAAAVDADDAELDADADAPSKIVTEQITLDLACRVSFVDGFAGISDGRSLRTIIGALAPRGLVLIGSPAADTAAMAAACARELPAGQTAVFAPAAGEPVTLRLASSYPVGLSSALLGGLSRHQLGSCEVAWLDGVLAPAPPAAAAAPAAAGADSTTAAAAAAAAEAGSGGDDAPQLVVVPAGSAAAAAAAAAAQAPAAAAAAGGGEPMEVDASQPAEQQQQQLEGAGAGDEQPPDAADTGDGGCGDHGGIFIGNVKLSEVKQALASAGIPSEFRGGRLVVSGCLVVSRDGPEGQLLMEGPLCEQYYAVRDTVYGQYNVC